MRKREGNEPRYENERVGADGLRITEGHLRGANGHGPRELTGVDDRGTAPRQSRELGRSYGALQGRGSGGTTGKPGGSPMTHRKSDALL
jgi:hypothetical protein